MALIQYLSRIHFDFGALAKLPDEIACLRLKRPLLVTDAGVAAAGLLERALDAAAPTRPVVYDRTPGNPNEAALRECMAIWQGEGCDGVIALGGGSPIDLGKAVALLATHGGSFADYGVKTGGSEQIGPVAPQIAIPTAAGTGAEVGRACVMILDSGDKCVAVNLNMVAGVTLCDPELTLSLPPRMTAATGMDALSHGIETLLSPTENPPAAAIAMDCVQRAGAWLRRAVEDGQDRQARREMMMAALEGGMTLQKGLGGTHAMVSPLGETGLHHGELIGVVLPHVLRFNASAAPEGMARLRFALGLPPAADIADWVARLAFDIGLPRSLSEMGFDAGRIPEMAAKAAKEHLSATNPRPADAADYETLLHLAYNGPPIVAGNGA